MRCKRKAESVLVTTERRRKNAICSRVNRNSKTLEQQQDRLQTEKERLRLKREAETVQEYEARIQAAYLQTMLNWESETPEEFQRRLQQRNGRMKARRELETESLHNFKKVLQSSIQQ